MVRMTPGSSASSLALGDVTGAGCEEMTPVSILGAGAEVAAGDNHSGVDDMALFDGSSRHERGTRGRRTAW